MSADIESMLATLGVTIVREQGNELIGLCPMHEKRTGKSDRHPSWSINSKTYSHHCFSCGYGGDLNVLFLDLAGEVPEDLQVELKREALIHAGAELGKKKGKTKEPEEDEGPVISEWTLQHYAEVPKRLLKLKYLKREVVDRFGVRWDAERRCWVLPIRLESGELVGYQFRQKGNEINHPEEVPKSRCLFGHGVWPMARRIALVESPLDAVRMAGASVPALSSFGAWVSSEQIDILARNYAEVCLALDDDKAGWQNRDRVAPILRRRGVIVSELDYRFVRGKDPGEEKSDTRVWKAWRSGASFGLLR